MIDLSVVVLPAPLRPRSVTTSPAGTSNVTPCSTCDSPYHALRSRTASNGAPAGTAAPDAVPATRSSGMRCPQIGFDHRGMPGHVLVAAFGQDFASREHR